MTQELKKLMRKDIEVFAQGLCAYEAGEMDKKTYKGFSGGYGSYAQREGGHMLRLRMAGGRLTKRRMKYLAFSAEQYEIRRMKLTTCQSVQLHDLQGQDVAELMGYALEAGICTRGGGGDFPRNVMVSPLSGVEQGEYFDVLPWAEEAGEYLLSLTRELHMPRKLKVAFSNGPANQTHATFRDLGFAARPDGKFDVYCAGGLGPNPKLGVRVAEAVAPQDIAACIDAMIAVFTAFGNYENRAKARTRYLQDVLGEEGLKAEFSKALEQTMKTSPKLSAQPYAVSKAGKGTISGPRVIPQKQEGLYAVSYHPLGGNLSPKKPRELYDLISGMEAVESRIGPDGTMYFINLTAEEAVAVLAATADGAETPFQHSVSCVGASTCQQGVRDSQALLAAMLEAVEKAGLPENALPAVRVSGCPSSCGAHQAGTLGFVGGVKLVDGKPQPAFTLLVNGQERQGSERLGESVGAILQEQIPDFIVELGKTVAESGLGFDEWFPQHEAELRALAAKYIEG